MKLLIFGVLLLVLLTTVVSAQYYDDYDDYYYDYGYDAGCCCMPMFGLLAVAGGIVAYNSKQ